MNREMLMKKLKDEGFPCVFEWEDPPNTDYKPHSHKGSVSFYITKGDVTIWFKDGKEKIVSAGERYDMKPGIEHWARVGPGGCSWIVGEEIEGDA